MRTARVMSAKEKLIDEIHKTSGLLTKARKRYEIAGDILTILEVKLFNLQQRYTTMLQPTITQLREELPKASKRQHVLLKEQKAERAKKMAIKNIPATAPTVARPSR